MKSGRHMEPVMSRLLPLKITIQGLKPKLHKADKCQYGLLIIATQTIMVGHCPLCVYPLSTYVIVHDTDKLSQASSAFVHWK